MVLREKLNLQNLSSTSALEIKLLCSGIKCHTCIVTPRMSHTPWDYDLKLCAPPPPPRGGTHIFCIFGMCRQRKNMHTCMQQSMKIVFYLILVILYNMMKPKKHGNIEKSTYQ